MAEGNGTITPQEQEPATTTDLPAEESETKTTDIPASELLSSELPSSVDKSAGKEPSTVGKPAVQHGDDDYTVDKPEVLEMEIDQHNLMHTEKPSTTTDTLSGKKKRIDMACCSTSTPRKNNDNGSRCSTSTPLTPSTPWKCELPKAVDVKGILSNMSIRHNIALGKVCRVATTIAPYMTECFKRDEEDIRSMKREIMQLRAMLISKNSKLRDISNVYQSLLEAQPAVSNEVSNDLLSDDIVDNPFFEDKSDGEFSSIDLSTLL